MATFKTVFLGLIIMLSSYNYATSQSTTKTEQSSSFKTSIIKVKGITCSKDLSMISDNVVKLKGVESCDIAKKGPTSKFKVKYNTLLVTAEEIHAAIENTGSCENPNEKPYKVKEKG